MSTTLVGTVVGRFRVDRRIGKGGMGAVYQAFDEKLERDVALKMLLENATDPTQRKRFLREARLAAKLTHPNIATVFEVDELDGQIFIVMELLEGKSLRRMMADRRLSYEDALAIARDIARALARAHNAGVAHRDIKPENVFITEPSPGAMLTKVLDFGLAREKPRGQETTATDTLAGGTWGTPGYLSPEQAHGTKVDARSDIFSFGVVFYEMLAGRRAFRADNNFGLLLAVAKSEPEPLRSFAPEISEEIHAVVMRCLEKDKDKRFADGSELASALEGLVKSGPTASIRSASLASLDEPATEQGEAPTMRTSMPVIDEANTQQNEIASAGPVETSPRDEIPTFERERRQRLGIGIAIAAGLGVAIVLILVVASFVTGPKDPDPSVASSAWAPPPAPPDPPPAVIASADPASSVAPASSSAAPHATGGPPPKRHSKAADCAQPFIIDSKGVRIPKMQCL